MTAGVADGEDADSFMISIISHVPTDEMLQLFDEGNLVLMATCCGHGRRLKKWIRIWRCLRKHCRAPRDALEGFGPEKMEDGPRQKLRRRSRSAVSSGIGNGMDLGLF